MALHTTHRLSLHWCHNHHDGASIHQPHGCLFNRLFRRNSKKTSKLRVTGLCVGNSPGPVNSPHKGPVTRKMFPFDDVIMPRCVIWDPHDDVWTRKRILHKCTFAKNDKTITGYAKLWYQSCRFRLNKLLSNQSNYQWFETPWHIYPCDLQSFKTKYICDTIHSDRIFT